MRRPVGRECKLLNGDNAVPFDTILTTSNFNGKLPQAKPFNLTT